MPLPAFKNVDGLEYEVVVCPIVRSLKDGHIIAWRASRPSRRILINRHAANRKAALESACDSLGSIHLLAPAPLFLSNVVALDPA